MSLADKVHSHVCPVCGHGYGNFFSYTKCLQSHYYFEIKNNECFVVHGADKLKLDTNNEEIAKLLYERGHGKDAQ